MCSKQNLSKQRFIHVLTNNQLFTPSEMTGNEKPMILLNLFKRIMRSLLMTDAYNHAEELRISLEADLEIMESLEALMLLEEQVQKKVSAKEKKTVVKHLHYRKTA